MRTLRRTLLSTTLLALAAALGGREAVAQPVTGLYLGAGVGVNFWHDQSSGGIRVHDNDAGIVGLASVGWGFGNGLRLEVEGNYRGSGVDQVTTAVGGIGNTGNVRNYGVMVNALFDFDLSSFGIPPSGFMPYIGGGVGYGWMQISNARFPAAGTSVYEINDTDGQFAYQGIAGVSWGLGGLVPGLSLTTEYRFYGTVDQTLSVTRLSGPAVAGVPGQVKLPNVNHAAIFGVRYAFNPPRPPAAAPVEPAVPPPARSYLVFFDWDRADLTDRARQIIAEAAQNARRVQTTRIEVAGHADRSGSPQYNMGLSRRRADNVAAELVRQGINRGEIAVTAFGETRPLVPTADGVREPQNRRVEIVLR
jgi:OmpA-OmpF porin, OOP family